MASSLCHKNRNLKDYKLQSRPSLKTAILLCHAQVAIGPPFLAVRDALLMDIQLLNVIPGSVLAHRALSAGEPQLYGKGKPKKELFVTGGPKAGFSLLLVGTSCQLILGQGKAASKQKVFCTRREKSNLGGASVCIFKDSFNVIFFFFGALDWRCQKNFSIRKWRIRNIKDSMPSTKCCSGCIHFILLEMVCWSTGSASAHGDHSFCGSASSSCYPYNSL